MINRMFQVIFYSFLGQFKPLSELILENLRQKKIEKEAIDYFEEMFDVRKGI